MLVLAFLANRIFRLTRVPDVLVLMLLGLLVGPGLGLMHPADLTGATKLLGTIAIILVLFEGGLELDLRHTLRHFPGSFLLACVAFILSSGLVALIVVKGLGLSLHQGLIVGAVLGCTSSTVVLPVLQQIETKEPVKVTLMLEASWGDVLAVLTVGLLTGLDQNSGPIAKELFSGVVSQVGIALLFALAAGVLWSRLLTVLSEVRFWQVLTFSIVLLLYAGTEALGANGLIAVLGMGLTLSNFPGIDPRLRLAPMGTAVVESQHALLSFHSELAFLVRTFFFVLIGAIAPVENFRQFPLLMAGTIAALFVARWLAIQISKSAWHGIDKKDRDLMLWIMPRGLITVVLAIHVAGHDSSGALAFLPGLAFAVILVTNLMVVVGSAQTSRAVSPAETATSGAAVQVSASRRWVLDAVLLFLLAAGGVMMWYGNLAPEARPTGIHNWVKTRVMRQR